MLRSLLAVILSALSFSLSAQCTSNRYRDTIFHQVTTTSGVYFGTADTYLGVSQDLYLDFYEPTGDTLTKRPLIVYAFGGAFLIGTRNQPPIPTYCTYYAQCGYAVASIDYRIGFDVLSTGSAVRAVYRGIQDLRGAVRFLCQRYPQYRIDTTAIFLTGSSAGCISGISSCFMEQSDVPAYVHGILTEPSHPRCYDCAHNTDNGGNMPLIRGLVNHWGAILDTSFMRTTVKDNIPMISLAGDQDNLVPYTTGSPFGYPVFPTVQGSLPMHYRLSDIGVKNELHPLVGYGHEPWLLAPQLIDTCFKYEVPFLYSILKPKPLTISGDSTVCTGGEGTYTVPQRNGSHYCWNYTGGTQVSHTNNTVTIQWTSTGTHLITAREMTMNDVNGDLDSFYVSVISHPVAAVADSVLHTHVQFTDASVGATSWLYAFGDGGQSSSASPSHTYVGEDTFRAALIVSNGYCADTAYQTVVTDTCPVAHIVYAISNDTLYVHADTTNGVVYDWTFGDGGVDSGSTAYHIYTHTQNYLVGLSVTSAKACTASSSVIVAYQAAINSIGEVEGQRFTIYPNPADDLMHIRSTEAGTIELYDMSGQKVAEATIESGIDKVINISYLSSGIYIYRVSGQTGVYTGKFIKN